MKIYPSAVFVGQRPKLQAGVALGWRDLFFLKQIVGITWYWLETPLKGDECVLWNCEFNLWIAFGGEKGGPIECREPERVISRCGRGGENELGLGCSNLWTCNVFIGKDTLWDVVWGLLGMPRATGSASYSCPLSGTQSWVLGWLWGWTSRRSKWVCNPDRAPARGTA